MSASGGSLNTKANASGAKDIDNLNESLKSLHKTIEAINQVSRPLTALGTVSSPISSLSQARTQYEEFSSEIDNQRRILGQYQVTYDKFTRSLFDNARQIGRSVQDYVAMRQELVALGTQADIATKQISGLARYSGMGFAQTTQTFQALSVQGAAFSPGNGVGFDANQQSRFMAMLGDAVEKGAAGGLRITMPELLSGLTGLQTQMANLGVRSNITGNLGILTAFNASGGLGVSGERGAGVLSSMNQAVAPGGAFNPMMQLYLAQQNPGASYFQLQYMAEQGITGPKMFKDLVAMERARFGPNADPYMVASAMAQDFTMPSAHVAMDMMNSIDKMGILDVNDPKYDKLAKYMGQGKGDYTDLMMKIAAGELRGTGGKLDTTKAAAAFKTATGRDINVSKIGGNIANLTEESLMDILASEGAPEASVNYARANEDTSNNTTNNLLSAADNMKEASLTVKRGNELFSSSVDKFGAFVGATGLGGVLGGLNVAVSTLSGVLAAYFAYSAAKTVVPWLPSLPGMPKGAPPAAPTTASPPVPGGAPRAPGVPGGGGFNWGALGQGLTLIGLGAYLFQHELPEERKREEADAAAEPESVKAARYARYKADKAKWGAMAPFHNGEWLVLNDAQYKDIQRREAEDQLKAQQNGGPGQQASSPSGSPSSIATDQGLNANGGAGNYSYGPYLPGQGPSVSTGEKLDEIISTEQKTNELLGQILSKINLDTAPMTDQNFQRRYGISMPAPNSAAGIGSGATAGATAAGIYGVPGGGTSVGGGGLDTIFGGSNHPISQAFGVQDTNVDQSIYDKYGKDYGMPVDPNTGHVGHTGVDIGVARGTKVYSPVNGKVINAGGTGFFRDDPSDNAEATGELKIQMKNEDQVILGHLSVIYVKVGQEVSVGQLVALSGTADTDHVHIEYRKKNTPGMPTTNTGYTIVDPIAALGALSPSAGGGGPSTGMETNVARWAGQTQQTFGDIMDPDIMSAIMTNESHGDPSAYNASGDAYGLFQQVGLKSFDPNVQFQAARRLAQEKLSAINAAYKKNGLDPDARQRAVDFALAWGGHFDYDTGRLNPNSRDKGSGQTAAQLAAIFLKNYDAIKAGRATGGGGNQSRQAMTAYAMATGDTDLYGDASSYGDATGGMSIGFEPLTVNVVFPDGSGYQTKLALTSKDPYTNLRQVGTRNRA